MTKSSSITQDVTTPYTPLKILVVLLAGRESAIELSHVKEILPVSGIEPLPNAINAIIGLINVRGDVIPVIDLNYFINKTYQPAEGHAVNQKIILIESNYGLHGLLVDAVLRVEEDMWEIHASSDSLKQIQKEYILFTKAITNLKGYSLPIIEIQNIISYVVAYHTSKTNLNNIAEQI